MEQVSDRLGVCLICGNRVFDDEDHVKSADGYCHHNCLAESGQPV